MHKKKTEHHNIPQFYHVDLSCLFDTPQKIGSRLMIPGSRDKKKNGKHVKFLKNSRKQTTQRLPFHRAITHQKKTKKTNSGKRISKMVGPQNNCPKQKPNENFGAASNFFSKDSYDYASL